MSGPRIAPLLAAGLVTALTGGCADLAIGPGAVPEPARESVAWQPDPAGMRLAEAAERAEAALTVLARIRAAEASPAPAGVPANVSPELRRPVTLDWVGPVESLAETLAGQAGYRFAVAGPPPVRPVMVAVRAQELPLIEVLRDAGLQAGSAATLVVNAGNRTVRLDWSGERPGTGEHPGAAPEKEGS